MTPTSKHWHQLPLFDSAQFAFPYAGLFNPLRSFDPTTSNPRYALTGPDGDGASKKQEESKKRREKKRMSQIMYSDNRRQRLNERLRAKLENRKSTDDGAPVQAGESVLNEQELLTLFKDEKQQKTKKRKKKKRKKKKKSKATSTPKVAEILEVVVVESEEKQESPEQKCDSPSRCSESTEPSTSVDGDAGVDGNSENELGCGASTSVEAHSEEEMETIQKEENTEGVQEDKERKTLAELTLEDDFPWHLYYEDELPTRSPNQGFQVVKRKEKKSKPRMQKNINHQRRERRRPKRRHRDRQKKSSSNKGVAKISPRHRSSFPIRNVQCSRISPPQVGESSGECNDNLSESSTTQYFTMPSLPKRSTHDQKADPSLDASLQKQSSPSRPPPGFETNPNSLQSTGFVPMTIYPPHQVIPMQQNQPPPQIHPDHTHQYPPEIVDFANLQLAKPFQTTQNNQSVMYLRLPHDQIVSLPLCPEEQICMETYQMNLDLSYPFNVNVPVTPCYVVPIQPEMVMQPEINSSNYNYVGYPEHQNQFVYNNSNYQ